MTRRRERKIVETPYNNRLDDDSKFMGLSHQLVMDEKTRCRTRKFEAHFLSVATANRWPVCTYRGGPHEELSAGPSRR